ncbi:hypothetical protein Tco_1328258 [Tanacetum coccineum]
MLLMRDAVPSTYILAPRSRTPPSGTPPILPIPSPTSSLPLPLPSTNRRADVLEAVLPPQKRLCIAPGPRFEVGDSSSTAAARSLGGFRAYYSFVGTLDAEIRRDLDREDAYEIYRRLDDAQSDRSLMTGFADVLAERDVTRSRNAEDSHDSGTGVVGLMQWFEKMETVFNISNYTIACQVKFITCTLQGISLKWWKSHVKTVTHEVTYAMPWKTLKKIMTDKYCLRGEIKKIDIEIMFLEESDEIEKYVGGFPDMIHGSVMASKPKTMQEAIEFVAELMDKKINTFAELQGPGEKKPYGGSKPLCPNQPAANNNQRAQGTDQRVLTCFEYGAQGHFRSNCPKLKNRNQGNQVGNDNVVAGAYVMGTTGTNLNSNVVTVVIVCAEKIVCIPFGSEILIVCGDERCHEHGSRLNIISCTKISKYLLKGCHVFLAHVTTKKAEDKSEEKRLEDVPISKQEHEEHLKLILELLKKEDFHGINVDPAKIESIKDWASPMSPTEIR